MRSFLLSDLIPGRRKKRLIEQEKRREEAKRRVEKDNRISSTFGMTRYQIIRCGLTLNEISCTDHTIEYSLSFPKWEFSETKDPLDIHKKIIYNDCILKYKGYCITCKEPLDLVAFVNRLRYSGKEILPNIYEVEKQRNTVDKGAVPEHKSESFSAKMIYDLYINNPTSFELFCAELFEAGGFSTRLTPPVNDGGFDIKMNKDGKTYIVECKCFSKTNSVGRPIIQKIVGANVIEKADQMIVITTSVFTKSAVDYAKESNVKLIDGKKLEELCERYGLDKTITKERHLVKRGDNWWLTKEDLEALYPRGTMPKAKNYALGGLEIDMGIYLMNPDQIEKAILKRREMISRSFRQGIQI